MPDGGAFASFQPAYAAHRIATYPLTEDKTPAIRGYDKVGAKGSRELASKFVDANAFGFCAGRRNCISVIDIDAPDERLVAEIEARYGMTPLHVMTPSGGRHLYYRHAGEARRIRPLPYVDILGGGNVVAAGSIVPKGRYAIERGTLDDLDRLPSMRSSCEAATPAAQGKALGHRNRELFAHCMREARRCDDLTTLLDSARTFNEEAMMPPLPEAEVVKTAQSAWGYEQRGENRYGATGAWFPTAEVEALIQHPDAFVLLSRLRALNLPESVFWITNDWSASFGWTRKRLAAARTELIALGYIELVQVAMKGSPALFRFTQRRRMAKAKGGQN